MKMIAKRFNRAVRGVRKNYEMFRHETSMRKPFFNKATCSSTKKEFLHILFPWKFQKMSRKKPTKTLRKINRVCFDEYFCKCFLKVDKTYLQISFKTIFFKMLWAECRILWQIFFILSTSDTTKPFLSNFFFVYIMGFDENVKMGFSQND